MIASRIWEPNCNYCFPPMALNAAKLILVRKLNGDIIKITTLQMFKRSYHYFLCNWVLQLLSIEPKSFYAISVYLDGSTRRSDDLKKITTCTGRKEATNASSTPLLIHIPPPPRTLLQTIFAVFLLSITYLTPTNIYGH